MSVNHSTLLTDNSGSNLRLIGNRVDIQNWRSGVNSNLPLSTQLAASNYNTIMTLQSSNINVTAHIIPTSCNVFDLGSSNFRFRDIYLSGNTIDIDGLKLSKDTTTGGLSITSSNNQPIDTSARNIYATGNIGIGTTTAMSALHVHDTNVPTITLTTSTAGQGTLISTPENSYLRFGASNQYKTHVLVVGDSFTTSPGRVNFRYSNYVAFDNTNGSNLQTERIRIVSDGSLGIGTTNPQQKLHVMGSVMADTQFQGQPSDTAALPSFTWATNSNLGMFRAAANALAFTTSGTEKVRVASDGNVGVGTAIPAQKLHVIGNILASGTLIASNVSVLGQFTTVNTTTSNAQQMVINNAGTGPALKVVQSGVNTIAEFFDAEGTVPMLFLADGGNVGIGTSTPLDKLHIQGTVSLIQATNPMLEIGANNTGSNLTLGYATATNGLMSGTVAGDAILRSDVINRRMHVGVGTGAPTMSVSSANVGIGTTNPALPLDVWGSARIRDMLVVNSSDVTEGGQITLSYGGCNFTQQDNGTWNLDVISKTFRIHNQNEANGRVVAMQVLENGNVGIGTSIPLARVHVVGNINVINSSAPSLLIGVNNTAGAGGSNVRLGYATVDGAFATNAGTGDGIIRVDDATKKLHLQTGNSNAVLTVTNANVGIGTTSPAEKMDVNGGLRVQGRVHLGPTLRFENNVTSTRNLANAYIGQFNSTEFENFLVIGCADAQTTTGSYTAINQGIDMIYKDNGRGLRIFRTTDWNFGNTTNRTEVAVFSGSGNLGIGTVSPFAKLHVTSATSNLITSSATRTFLANDPSNHMISFTSTNGNLGTHDYAAINVTPNKALADGGGAKMTFLIGGSATNMADNARFMESMCDGIANNIRTYFPNGNVGIGTSPSQKLHVHEGNILAYSASGTSPWIGGGNGISSYFGMQTVGDNYLRLGALGAGSTLSDWLCLSKPNGNVGVGITNPAQKLDVNGVAQCVGDLIIKGSSAIEGGQVTMNAPTGTTGSWIVDSYNKTLRIFNNIDNITTINATFQPTGGVSFLGSLGSGNVDVSTGGTPYLRIQRQGGWAFGQGAGLGMEIIANASRKNDFTNAPADIYKDIAKITMARAQTTDGSSGYIAFSTVNDTVGDGSGVMTERMRIAADGNVGIGTATATCKLYSLSSGTNGNGLFAAGIPSSSYQANGGVRTLTVYTQNSTGGVIIDKDNTGATDIHLLMRTSTAAGTGFKFIEAQTGIGANLGFTNAGAGSAVVFTVFGNGNANNTNGVFSAFSDIKMKENIQNARDYLDDLRNVRVVKYSLKNTTSDVPTHIGVIAQEIEQIFPNLVEDIPDQDEHGNNVGTVTKTVKYSILYMIAVKALQELAQKHDDLQARVTTLETTNQQLLSRLEALEAKMNT